MPVDFEFKASVHYQVAMCQVASLPSHVHSGYKDEVRIACIEDWYVNMRLLIEFFKIQGHNTTRDFTAPADFIPRITKAKKKHLIMIWEASSSLVSHLSTARNVINKFPFAPYEIKDLKNSVEILLEISRQFAGYLHTKDQTVGMVIDHMNKHVQLELDKI